MTMRWCVVAVAGLTLAGCGSRTPDPEPTPEPTETQSPDPSETEAVSIIRPDVEVERDIAPLEPLLKRIGFDAGGYELSAAALADLQSVLQSRQIKAGGAIVIGGHTDSAGSDRANLRTSQARADVVAQWLVDQGVAQDRITVIAFGEQNPLEPNAKENGDPNETGRAANRRVMIAIAVPDELLADGDDAPTLIEQVSAED